MTNKASWLLKTVVKTLSTEFTSLLPHDCLLGSVHSISSTWLSWELLSSPLIAVLIRAQKKIQRLFACIATAVNAY